MLTDARKIPIFDLIEDVLDALISTLPSESLLGLALTCRTGYNMCLPYLLRSVHIRNNPEQLRNFCESMLVDARRIQLLHHLMLGLIQDDSVSAILGPLDLLASVLEKATNLESFHFTAAEFCISLEPRLSDAIVRCPRLVSIGVQHVGERVSDIISRMHGLREISMPMRFDAITVLQPFQNTLETLYLTLAASGPVSFDAVGSWPQVRRLQIHLQEDISGDLITAFPNIREVSLIGTRQRRSVILWTCPMGLGQCWIMHQARCRAYWLPKYLEAFANLGCSLSYPTTNR